MRVVPEKTTEPASDHLNPSSLGVDLRANHPRPASVLNPTLVAIVRMLARQAAAEDLRVLNKDEAVK